MSRIFIAALVLLFRDGLAANLLVLEGDSAMNGWYNAIGSKPQDLFATNSFFSGWTITNIAKPGDYLIGAQSPTYTITNQVEYVAGGTNLFCFTNASRYLFVMIGFNDWDDATNVSVWLDNMTNYWWRARTNGYIVIGGTVPRELTGLWESQGIFYDDINTGMLARSNLCDVFIDFNAIVPDPTSIHMTSSEWAKIGTNLNAQMWAWSTNHIRYVDNQAVGYGNNGTSWINAWTNLTKLDKDTGGVVAGDNVYIAARSYTNLGSLYLKGGTAGNWVRYYFTNGLAELYCRTVIRAYTELNGASNPNYETNFVSVYDTALITNNINLWIHRETNWYDANGVGTCVDAVSDPTVTKWVRMTAPTTRMGPDPPKSYSPWNFKFNYNTPTSTGELAYIWMDISSAHGNSGCVNTSGAGTRSFGTFNVHHILAENMQSDFYDGTGGIDIHHCLIRNRDPSIAGGCNDTFVFAGDAANSRIYNNIVEPAQNAFIYMWGRSNDVYNWFFYGNLITPVRPAYQGDRSDGGGGYFEQDTLTSGQDYYIRSNICIFNNTWIGTTNGGSDVLVSFITKDNQTNDIYLDDGSLLIKNNLFIQLDTNAIPTPKATLSFYPAGATNNAGKGIYYGTNAITLDYNLWVQGYGGNLAPITWGQTGDDEQWLTNAAVISDKLGYTHNVWLTNSSFLADPQSYDYRPANSAVLMGEDLGSWTNLMPDLMTDIYGNTRGVSGTWAAGAIDYDNALLLLLTFEDDFPTLGYSADSSPNEANMIRYGWGAVTTNFATIDTGKIGSQSAAFVPYWDTHPFPEPYETYIIGQYGAVTNMGGMTTLTNATIALWAKFAAIDPDDRGREQNASFLDTGYGDLGDWMFGRYYAGTCGNPMLMIMTNTGGITDSWRLEFPENDTFYWFTNGTWTHFAVTVACGTDGTNLTAILYTNGVQVSSNFLALATSNAVPYLTANDPQGVGVGYPPWLSVGVRTHNGTPPLDDADGVPNNGWLNGSMDDVRIYNRVLSATEISALGSTALPYAATPTFDPPDPVIDAFPTNITISATTAGATIYWTTNGVTPTTGDNEGTTAGLLYDPTTLKAIAVADGYQNSLVAEQTYSTATAPSITSGPDETNTVAGVGDDVTFHIHASGSLPLSYQWRLTGNAIADETASECSLNSVTTEDAGEYSVVITNSFGSITSGVATLTVTNAPAAASNAKWDGVILNRAFFK